MIAFGGNGPLHAVDVARILGISEGRRARHVGVFAAAGMLSADVEHNFVHASPRRLADLTADWIVERWSSDARRPHGPGARGLR